MTHRIAINGINSKVGGGKTILVDYMQGLDQQKLEDRYFLLTTNREEFDWLTNANITVVNLPAYYANAVLAPVVYEIFINSWLKKNKIDLVFNHGDLVINTEISQVYLFDWPYAIYVESVVWKRMQWKDWLKRRVKLHFLKKRLRYPAVIIAQTPVVKRALEESYNLANVKIVPNSVSLENKRTDVGRKFVLPSGKKLLCLTHYYPHKNLEIFLPLAERIRAAKKDYKIIITIDKHQHPGASKLLRDIQDQGLNDVIVNIGAVAMTDLPSLYKVCDGLLLPTLLESFSCTYVEAMFHGIPIFTSNLDFAKGVCGDAACYFDPLDPDDIFSKLDEILESTHRMKVLIDAGHDVLSNFLNPPQVFSCYQEILHAELERTSAGAR